MNIRTMRKVGEARNFFSEMNIKKSGHNKYQHFKYFELQDIIPAKNTICEHLNLVDIYKYTSNMATLEIYDLEQPDTQEPVIFSIPIPEICGNQTTKQMQDIGALQTYSHRYLLLQFLDIVECDMIDRKDQKNIPKSTPLSKKSKSSENTSNSTKEALQLENQALIGLQKSNISKMKKQQEATKVLNKVKRLININNWNINDISNYELILNDAAFRKDNNITDELYSLIYSILQAELLNVDA